MKTKDLYQTYLRQSKEARVEEGIVIIPDVSGYTNFVNNICVEAGRYITSQLLAALLDANTLDMSVSEIEGDAILFYRFGAKPSVAQLKQQYEAMLKSFNDVLDRIEHYVGHSLQLSLKLIAHYGRFSEYTIGNFKKLYGEPVVKAHSLLKNEVKSNSYILMTADFLAEEMMVVNNTQDYLVFDYQDR